MVSEFSVIEELGLEAETLSESQPSDSGSQEMAVEREPGELSQEEQLAVAEEPVLAATRAAAPLAQTLRKALR